MHPYIIFGLLWNSALITFNRFVKDIPDWLYLPGLIIGIGAIIAGGMLAKSV